MSDELKVLNSNTVIIQSGITRKIYNYIENFDKKVSLKKTELKKIITAQRKLYSNFIEHYRYVHKIDILKLTPPDTDSLSNSSKSSKGSRKITYKIIRPESVKSVNSVKSVKSEKKIGINFFKKVGVRST